MYIGGGECDKNEQKISDDDDKEWIKCTKLGKKATKIFSPPCKIAAAITFHMFSFSLSLFGKCIKPHIICTHEYFMPQYQG